MHGDHDDGWRALMTPGRLFERPGGLPTLDLVDTHRFGSGVMLLTYRTR